MSSATAPPAAERKSLEARLRLWLLSSLALGTVVIAAGLVAVLSASLQRELENQVNVVGRALQNNLQLSVAAKGADANAAYQQIEWVRGLGEELVSVVVFRPDGAPLVSVTPNGRLDAADVEGMRADDTVGDALLQQSGQLVIRGGSAPGASTAVLGEGDSPGKGRDDDEPADYDLGDDLEAAMAADLEAAGDRVAMQQPEVERRGQVRVTLSAGPEALRQLSYVGFTGALLCLAAVLVLRRLLRDAAKLLAPAFAQAQRMSGGDFTERTHADYEELTILADAFNSISGSLSTMIVDVRRLAGAVSDTVEHVQAESSAIQIGVTRELKALEESEAAVTAMRDSVELTAAKLRELVDRAAASGDDAALIGQTNRDTAAALEALTGELARQTKSLEVVGVRTRSLFDNAHVLADATSQSRAAADRMMRSLEETTGRAEEAARLANTAMKESLEGGEAIENAVTRIGDIAAEAGIMETSLAELMLHVEQMKPVLGAIDEVTASTSLLALNAGILAAQAGEHGRGFHVVVEQLKALSHQTAGLTAKVDSAVSTVLEQRGHTVDAAARLNDVVRASLDDARRAGAALGAIRESTVESREVSQAIAAMVRGQRKDVTQTLQRIEQSAAAGTEVGGAAEALLDETKVLGEVKARFEAVVADVVNATKAQGALASRVGEAFEQLGGQVQTLASAQDRQNGDMARVQDAISQIRTVAEDARARAAALESVVLGLRGSADRLMAGLARFQTPAEPQAHPGRPKLAGAGVARQDVQ